MRVKRNAPPRVSPPWVKIEGNWICGYGGIGRRAGFRFLWSDSCGFDPHYPYQRKLTSCQKRQLVVFVNHSTNNKFGGVKMLDTIGAFGSGIGTNLLSDSLSKKLGDFNDCVFMARWSDMKCPFCNAIVPAGNAVCNFCGEALPFKEAPGKVWTGPVKTDSDKSPLM